MKLSRQISHGINIVLVGARFGQLIEQSYVIRWQLIEDAVAVLNNERIQKDHPLDPVGEFFRHFLYY